MQQKLKTTGIDNYPCELSLVALSCPPSLTGVRCQLSCGQLIAAHPVCEGAHPFTTKLAVIATLLTAKPQADLEYNDRLASF